jgi:ABC-2 type transport system ATP-binding protein
MDEAERCDRIVYILNGKLIARGTVAEVIAQSKLFTFIVEGENVRKLACAARRRRAWNMRPSSARRCM